MSWRLESRYLRRKPKGYVMVKWEKTNDEWGYRPTFEMKCRFCKVDMQARFSLVYGDYSMILKYKCPSCGWFAEFDLDLDKEYQKWVFEARGKIQAITPKMDEFRENAEISRQLEGLGYWGGR